jgi:hypothetical protein
MAKQIFVASLSALVLFAAAAAAQPAMQTQADAPCLRMNQIYSFAPIKSNDQAMVVTDRANRRYKLTFNGTCSGLDYNIGVAIHSHGIGGLSCVSRGDDVISKDPGVANNRCPVAKVEFYTAPMEKADMDAAAAGAIHH